jgi:AraC-like DNA-binding protein
MSEFRHERPTTSSQTVTPGATIVRHHHRQHQLVYPSRGAVSVTTARGTWIAPVNRAIWIPARHWHEHRFHGHTQFHCVAFDPDRFPDCPETPTVVAANPLLRELIITCSQTESITSDQHHRMTAVLYDQLLAAKPEAPLWVPQPRDERLQQACGLVAQELAVPITLQQLSRQVGVSERTLSRLFRDQLNMTYPQWRTQLRLQHAIMLLAEHLDVTAVAHRCGWATPSAFIDTYRHALGHTPGRQ